MILKLLKDVYNIEVATSKETAHQVFWWRSSSLGSCKRGQFLTRLLSGDFKVQHDQRTMDVFEIGNIVEDIKIAKLKKHPDYLVITQGEMFDKQFNLSGHFDALLIHKKTHAPFMFECKSKNSKAFTYMDRKGQGAMHHHKLQINSYMCMVNTSGFALSDEDSAGGGSDEYKWLQQNADQIDFVPFNNTAKYGATSKKPVWKLRSLVLEGSIVYVSKDDQRLLEYPVMAHDVNLLREWQDEVTMLEQAWLNKDVLPENEAGSWQGKYCQYCQAGLCEKLSSKEVVEALFEIDEAERTKLAPQPEESPF